MDGGGVQKFFNALQHVDPPEVGLVLTVLTVTGQHLIKKKKKKKITNVIEKVMFTGPETRI